MAKDNLMPGLEKIGIPLMALDGLAQALEPQTPSLAKWSAMRRVLCWALTHGAFYEPEDVLVSSCAIPVPLEDLIFAVPDAAMAPAPIEEPAQPQIADDAPVAVAPPDPPMTDAVAAPAALPVPDFLRPPEPTPAPQPVDEADDPPKPAPPKMAGPFAPWTAEDDALVRRLKAAGETAAEIGARIGRTAKAVEMRVQRLGNIDAKAKEPEAASPPPVETPPAPEPARPDDALPVSQKLSVEGQQLMSYLDGIGYARGWSAARDLDLVDGVTRGTPKDIIADQLGIERRDLDARFIEISSWPGIRGKTGLTLDGQALLLSILRLRARLAEAPGP